MHRHPKRSWTIAFAGPGGRPAGAWPSRNRPGPTPFGFRSGDRTRRQHAVHGLYARGRPLCTPCEPGRSPHRLLSGPVPDMPLPHAQGEPVARLESVPLKWIIVPAFAGALIQSHRDRLPARLDSGKRAVLPASRLRWPALRRAGTAILSPQEERIWTKALQAMQSQKKAAGQRTDRRLQKRYARAIRRS